MDSGRDFPDSSAFTRRRPALATMALSQDTWPDTDLIIQIAQHNERALDLLYTRYSKLVYSLALGIAHTPAMAEDVVQDVFQTVWQSAGATPPDTQLVRWLVGITRTCALDAIGAAGSHTAAQQRASSGEEPCLADRLSQLPEAEVVRPALAALPLAQRQVLELAYYGGMSCAAIAEEIGEPVGKVKLRLRTGLLMLREQLEWGM